MYNYGSKCCNKPIRFSCNVCAFSIIFFSFLIKINLETKNLFLHQYIVSQSSVIHIAKETHLTCRGGMYNVHHCYVPQEHKNKRTEHKYFNMKQTMRSYSEEQSNKTDEGTDYHVHNLEVPLAGGLSFSKFTGVCDSWYIGSGGSISE